MAKRKSKTTGSPLNTFLASKPFTTALNGARQGDWVPEAFFIDEQGRTLGMFALMGDLARYPVQVIEQALQAPPDIDSLIPKAAFVVLLAEVWISTNVSGIESGKFRPSTDPERKSAVVVSAYTVKDKKLGKPATQMYRMAAAGKQ
jgi:hypothetical protein